MKTEAAFQGPRPWRVPVRQGPTSAVIWIEILLVAICLEGLARRYLPIPGPLLYFAKDALLIGGILTLGRQPAVVATARRLVGPLPLLLGATLVWGVVTLAFPEHPSWMLGLLGLRQYLLWWVAPLVLATALLREGPTGRPERFLALLAIGVAALAAYQFSSAPGDAVNTYVWGDDPAAVATVGSTGRVRVSATFSYLSGFAAFVSLVTPLLLAAGASGRSRISRLAYVGAGAAAATTPMSGGRAPVLYVTVGALAVLGASGAIRSRGGRAAAVAVAVAIAAGVFLVPDATQGVRDRFDSEETSQRFRDLALNLPPVAILELEYPPFGIGAGAMQNAAAWLGIDTGWAAEAESQRLLIELGVPGYLLVWLSRFTLAVALIRSGRLLHSLGARPWAGVAWTYAGFCMLMPLTIDHVAQSLFFTGTGFILARLVDWQRGSAAPRA